MAKLKTHKASSPPRHGFLRRKPCHCAAAAQFPKQTFAVLLRRLVRAHVRTRSAG